MRIKNGDLTKATEKVIAHGCNCQGKMGAGVAKAIKETYPEAYHQYANLCMQHSTDELFGNMQEVESNGKIILNLLTQKFYGRMHKKFDYEAFKALAEHVVMWASENGYDTVAIPRIGAGLGKADWSKIREILEDVEVGTFEWTLYNYGKPPKVFITDLSDPVFHLNKVMNIIDSKQKVILITKNPKKLHKFLKQLSDVSNVVVQVSITGLGGTDWEPNVIAPDVAFKAARKLSELLDGRVVLRYDPIIPGVNDSDEWMRAFLVAASNMNILGVTTSVVDMYNHAKRRIKDAGYDVPFETLHYKDRGKILIRFKKIADELGVTTRFCCEAGFDSGTGGCDYPDALVDPDLMPSGNQRKNCGCPEYSQILYYSDECEHGCLYCYRKDSKSIQDNYAKNSEITTCNKDQPASTVAFTGHRPQKLKGYDADYSDLKTALATEITSLYEKGARKFITGMALGVDQWAAELLLAMKEEEYDIELVAAVPFPGQESRWPKHKQKRYKQILAQCNEVVMVHDTKPKDSKQAGQWLNERNHYMIDNANHLIAIKKSTVTSGGTVNAIKYAERNGVDIHKIDPDKVSFEDIPWEDDPTSYLEYRGDKTIDRDGIEQVDTNLVVQTCDINNHHDKENICDITYKSAPEELQIFTPDKKDVWAFKKDEITWEEYQNRYFTKMRKSYEENREEWLEFMKRDKVILVCYCKNHRYCHRYLLALILEKLGANYKGELVPF